MTDTRYGFGIVLSETSFDQALAKTRDALKQEGFGVLTEIDVRDTLQKKLGIEFRRYVILGACNPPLAHRALEADPDIGLLLPCNIVVQETPSQRIAVSIADPKALFELVDNPVVAPIAADVDQRLRRVLASIRDRA
ncbi:MAG TPA: DUF302 domain-containing protein [Polyangiaceae bacterium]|nr:DUF302 domain-containing protein [Polyangiaceae bacterium]